MKPISAGEIMTLGITISEERKVVNKGSSLIYVLIRKSEAIKFPFLIAMSLIMHPYTDFTLFLSHSPSFLTPFPRIVSPQKRKKKHHHSRHILKTLLSKECTPNGGIKERKKTGDNE